MSCVFCSIIAGDEPAHVVWEDTQTLAFLDIHPASPGHTLVVPKFHVEDIWTVDADDFAAVARATHAVCALIERRLEPSGLTLFQANRAAGWQDVFHLHVHVVPRSENDDLVQPWSGTRPDGAHLTKIVEALGGRVQ